MENSKRPGIYQIRNKKNNKRYIGGSTQVHVRMYEHFRNLKRGKSIPPGMVKDYNLWGAEAFEISELLYCTFRNIHKLEAYFMNEFKTLNSDYGYNIHESKKSDFKKSKRKPGVPRVVIKLSDYS